ncbi:chromophore lyase CpcT/CpeT [Pararhodonellum marinum]|uniref:chromophore lyase CpcT/CpeT n=1 Tax=Pararhodonellum marinum TaxID=2755358 RepID=UPI00188ED2E3|nr:chromophore lyase CpcT/CpeT [Pararhodonellum marinum]
MKKVCLCLGLIFWAYLPLFAQVNESDVDHEPLETLVAYMTGFFSSEAQSLEDQDYFHITLCMKEFSADEGGHWLYVEQAAASTPAQPYRQRIYHVFVEEEGVLTSKVYEMQNPEDYIGACSDLSLLGKINLNELIDRQGCAILLNLTDEGTFIGSTDGKTCLSSLRGAAYATSEVVIHRDYLWSWDRGWDKGDQQVWGAEKGAYRFDKLSE